MKLFTLPIIFATALFLTACGQEHQNLKKPNITTTTQKNTANTPDPSLPTYVALTDIPYPPFEMRDEYGVIIGMEIEIFDAIAKDQRFNIEYASHIWEGIFDKLNNDNPEIIVSAVTMTEEAKENALLSEPYYFSPYRGLAMDKAKLDNWKNLKIGISAGEDADEDLPELGVNDKNLQTYDTVFAAVSALIRGEVDVVVADSAVILYTMSSDAVKDFQDKFVSTVIDEEDLDSSTLVFAVDKAHPEILEKINAGLRNIKKSGELERILIKYNQTPTEHSK